MLVALDFLRLLWYAVLGKPTLRPEVPRILAPKCRRRVDELGRDYDLLSCGDDDVVDILAVRGTQRFGEWNDVFLRSLDSEETVVSVRPPFEYGDEYSLRDQ